MRRLSFLMPIAVLASVALAASLLLPASSASADSRDDAGPAIPVHGVVTTASGKTDPGVQVIIHAWPDQAVVAGLKVGQKVPWVTVGTATSNSSGEYSVRLPVSQLMPEATDGVVNLEADSSAGSYSFPVVITKNAGNAYMTGSDPVVNIAAKPQPFACLGFWVYYASLGKHWATIGETYVPTSHATQRFSYSHGQFSTLGVGTSGSGGYGSFAVDGSFSWSKTGSSGSGGSFPYYGAYQNVWYRTQFHWGEYECNHIGILGGFKQQVNGYFGGAHIENPKTAPSTKMKNCGSYVPGFAFHSNNSTAVTWRRSFGIHAGLGFLASVVTGYNGSAQVTYKLSRERYVCGQYGGPEGPNPRQLVVRFQ
jgi:hypothetical protein